MITIINCSMTLTYKSCHIFFSVVQFESMPAIASFLHVGIKSDITLLRLHHPHLLPDCPWLFHVANMRSSLLKWEGPCCLLTAAGFPCCLLGGHQHRDSSASPSSFACTINAIVISPCLMLLLASFPIQ